jgi:hypothetical protein
MNMSVNSKVILCFTGVTADSAPVAELFLVSGCGEHAMLEPLFAAATLVVEDFGLGPGGVKFLDGIAVVVAPFKSGESLGFLPLVP